MKGRRRIIPTSLQKKALDQLHVNRMGILACESIDWMNINANIESTIENCPIFLDFQPTQPKDKTLSHRMSGGCRNLS